MNFKIIPISICLLLIVNVDLYSQGFGVSKKIKNWYFHQGEVHLGGRESLDHSEWKQVTVPHDWSVSFPASPNLASCTGYLPGGIAWYRTGINIASDEQGKRFYIYFGGVYNNSEVYINGKWLGKRPNGYVPFYYEITNFIKFDKENIIAVRVDHNNDADSRWYTGSGIYREVKLITTNKTHLEPWGTYYTAEQNGEDAVVHVSARINCPIENENYQIKYELFDHRGSLIASSSKKLNTGSFDSQQRLEVHGPNLWSVNSPYLYQLKTSLIKDEQVLDNTEIKVGIRYLKFDPSKGFALNGNWMKIKGVCLHHDAGVLGAAVPKEVWKERLLRLKEIGVTGIRMSHNPQSTDLYDLCDEMGFLVMDEAFDEWEYPKKKWIEGWNVGDPGFQGASEYFREWGKKDLETMILRDRNHPSIIMWSIGNEVDYPNDPYSHPVMDNAKITQYFVKGYLRDQPHADRLGDIATELVPIVKSLDSSRPVTAALAGAVMSNETEYPDALDIVGYNYTEHMYDMDHKKYPTRVLYGSETRHDLEAWKSVRDKDFIFGQFIWTGLDYLGESGRWPSRGFTTGMIDLANNIKPRGYFRKALWSDEPMVYIGTYPKSIYDGLSMDAPDIWNYSPEEMIRVVSYTNAEKVELYLNGEKIGKSKKYDDNTAILSWDVPYSDGELKAIAYQNGEVIAEHRLHTSSSPIKLKLENGFDLNPEKGKVAILHIQALDQNNNLCKLASNPITVNVKGAARLLGIENASNNVAENYLDNTHNLLRGKATIYVELLDDSQDFQILISSPYLEGIALTREK